MDYLQVTWSFISSEPGLNAIVSGTIAGIFATPVVALVIGLYRAAKHGIILIPKRIIWCDFLKNSNEIPIILTTRIDPNKPSSTQKVSLTEVKAYSEIRTLFASLRKNAVLKAAKDGDYEEISKSSYISLGGQKSNEITKEFLHKNKSKFNVLWDKNDEETLSVDGVKYTAKKNHEGYVSIDYGVIMKTRAKNSVGNKISEMVIFGVHGFGTLGAVLCAKNIATVQLLSSHPDVLVVVEVKVKKQEVTGYRILNKKEGNFGG